jgi:glutathione S-transferase
VKDLIEDELRKAPCLFSDCFTATDVMIGSMFIQKRRWGAPPEPPKIKTMWIVFQPAVAMKISK